MPVTAADGHKNLELLAIGCSKAVVYKIQGSLAIGLLDIESSAFGETVRAAHGLKHVPKCAGKSDARPCISGNVRFNEKHWVCGWCSSTETLNAEDKFFCDACSGLQEAQKRFKIKVLPPILCLHLKRFKYIEQYDRCTF